MPSENWACLSHELISLSCIQDVFKICDQSHVTLWNKGLIQFVTTHCPSNFLSWSRQHVSAEFCFILKLNNFKILIKLKIELDLIEIYKIFVCSVKII